MNRSRGVTLLELLVTLAVAAVLASTAVPSFVSMVRSNRSASEANAFLILMTLARSEAVKRNQNVIICKTSDGATCSTASTGWETGAMICSDVDQDGVFCETTPMEVVRAEVPLSKSSTIIGNTTVINSVTFDSSGRGTAGSFILKPGTENKYRRKLVLSNTGRPRVCEMDRVPADPTCT